MKKHLPAILTILLSAATTALAGIAVSPLKQEVVAKPGQPTKFTISLSYASRRPGEPDQPVHLQVMDYSVTEDGTLLFHDAGTQRASASPWIRLSTTGVTLAPGESQKIEGVVTAPQSAAGEYYSCVMVELGGQRELQSGVGVNYRIASGLFVTVPAGQSVRAAKVEKISLNWPTTQPARASSQPEAINWPKVVSVVHNTGQCRFDGTGRVRISKLDGRVLADVPLSTRRAMIQPGDSRRFEYSINWPMLPGQYRILVNLDYQSKWAQAQGQVELAVSSEQSAELRQLVRQAQAAAEMRRKSRGLLLASAPQVELRVPPGGFRANKIDLRADCDVPLDCEISLVAPPEGPSAVGMITCNPDRFTLEPKSNKTLALTVEVPATASGVHQATLVVESAGSPTGRDRLEIPIQLIVPAETTNGASE